MKRILIVLLSFICLFSAYSKKATSSSSKSTDKTTLPFYVAPNVDSYGTDPGVSSEVIRERLAALDTEMEMRYTDEVKKYIDNYMKNGRRQIANYQILSEYFMPIFEEALAEAGLPDELKYLPIIESALDSKATSYCGAGGLWQIMPSVARGIGMTVNSQLDERRDPYIASKKACDMLKKAYEKFGDWGLALASYNCGPGTLGKALKRAGGDSKSHTFWSVYNYLPGQTRAYVPKFIAIVYVMNYYQEHNVPQINVPHYASDTICVSQKTSLSKLAAKLNVPVSDIKALNPHFSTDVVPATASRPCNVILPQAAALAYKTQKGLSDPETDDVSKTYIASTGAAPTAVSKGGNAKETGRKHNPNSSNYYDEESTTFPGTYIKKVKSNAPASKQNVKAEIQEEEGTFDFINNMRTL